MVCPVCGHPLSRIEELLAGTETGTECRSCWKFFRRLKPGPRLSEVTVLRPTRRHRPRPARLRRAA